MFYLYSIYKIDFTTTTVYDNIMIDTDVMGTMAIIINHIME